MTNEKTCLYSLGDKLIEITAVHLPVLDDGALYHETFFSVKENLILLLWNTCITTLYSKSKS